MTVLLDTHFLIWVTVDSPQIRKFPWLGKYLPWMVSPISLIEIQFLAEIGRLQVTQPAFMDALWQDRRFVIDEPPMSALARRSFELEWTRDPFDRLLAAHSLVRNIPLCSVDRQIRQRHRPLPEELI